jgi:hypothetical protein
MFLSRYIVNYGRIYSKLIKDDYKGINEEITTFLLLIGNSEHFIDLYIMAISLLDSKNMFIYNYKNCSQKIIYKDVLEEESQRKSIDDFDRDKSIITTDINYNSCSCKEYLQSFDRFVLNNNYDNPVELKEKVSLKKLLQNPEQLMVDLFGLLSFEVITAESSAEYIYDDHSKLMKFIKQYVNNEVTDINLIYTTGEVICPHLLSSFLILKNGYVDIKALDDDTLLLDEAEQENKVLKYYKECTKTVYVFDVSHLNDWLYLHYNII